jgi:hypothetical protein
MLTGLAEAEVVRMLPLVASVSPLIRVLPSVEMALCRHAIVENIAGVLRQVEVHLHRPLGFIAHVAAGHLDLNLLSKVLNGDGIHRPTRC